MISLGGVGNFISGLFGGGGQSMSRSNQGILSAILGGVHALGAKVDIPDYNYNPRFVNYAPEDFQAIQRLQSRYATGDGFRSARQLAKQMNEATVADLNSVMEGLYGPQFKEARSQVAQVVSDQLSGQVSEATRRILARRSLGSAPLGKGVVRDAATYQLGLTAEDQVQRGQQGYRSLYALYKQSAPLTTARHTMNYTTLTAPGFVGSRLQDKGMDLSTQKYNSQLDFNNYQQQYAAEVAQEQEAAGVRSGIVGSISRGIGWGQGYSAGNNPYVKQSSS